jgi:Cu/Ag efflux pump CusA
MIHVLVDFALNNRFLVLAAGILLLISGVITYRSSRSGPDELPKKSNNR